MREPFGNLALLRNEVVSKYNHKNKLIRFSLSLKKITLPQTTYLSCFSLLLRLKNISPSEKKLRRNLFRHSQHKQKKKKV